MTLVLRVICVSLLLRLAAQLFGDGALQSDASDGLESTMPAPFGCQCGS
jgi:hypothetical protein